ncbi:DUF202 domain-containing protein [Gordonia sp. CPCC 205515]|uniref:DUF202 domain-containing protein n=1 Tax=Gordonia sp. CPCC 205515 TaxID=3140791 RepID=UPI003AF397C7
MTSAARRTGPSRVDPGLQPERTMLASVRTALSFVVIGLLSLRLAGSVSATILLVVGVTMPVGIVVFACLRGDIEDYAKHLAHGGGSDARRRVRRVAALTVATVLIGAIAIIAVATA